MPHKIYTTSDYKREKKSGTKTKQKKMTAMAQKGKRSSHFARAMKQSGGY